MTKASFFFLLLAIISCSSKQESKVTLAVAANMQHAMESLINEFESTYNIKVEASSSSSGILTTQIRQGAPFDIFLSADLNHPNLLYAEGLASSPEVYAKGKLILWTVKNDITLDLGINSLLDSGIKKIALANAETAPYGFAAAQSLEVSGLKERLNTKLIIGESISQVNQYIQSENVDIGFTSQSVLYSTYLSYPGTWIPVPDTLYSPIRQGIVLLNHGKKENLSNSKQFYKFMFSERAKEILSNYGYNVSQ
ncbi:MAG: molybdate ABC transporter substrate-binding protein [Reichenbachiella sp.]|uniref:molybdate ABC transporter substrate-binding protein n=1 Tax=Reichenbachiella sp. TaxID=2184521 RepID=UPI0029674E8F|nr:molybdate ABC transporter substrate-binding protein [Reichenbachiella sp.]MDW3209132.1 molybdate ABC transporter substrate-binding protein [Reichenbachiella sp.]